MPVMRSFLTFQHYFEDPEGKLDLPSSLKSRVKSWKRPVELLDEKVIFFV